MHKARKRLHQNFHALLKDKKRLASLQETQVENEQTKSIASWLGHLKLLEGVPFHHLVPDERMLPQESIRFFYVDSNWVNALISGAYSLGTTTYNNQTHDEALIDSVHLKTTKQALHRRSKKLKATPPSTDTLAVVTGFVLRSTAVSAFPGMEVEGYQKEGNALDIVRMEHLSKDILLCLFAGKISTLRLHNPPEGLHFGLDIQKKDNFTKTLKVMNSKDANENGIEIKNSSISIDENCYRKNNKNVLKIHTLVTAIQEKLKDLGQTSKTLTAADFALQMVEGVDMAQLEPTI